MHVCLTCGCEFTGAYCPQCGAAAPERRCRFCGLPTDEKRCPLCGEVIDSAGGVASARPEPNRDEPRRSAVPPRFESAKETEKAPGQGYKSEYTARPAYAPTYTPVAQPGGAYVCDKWMTLLLCLFAGGFGGHKFYERKFGMGILYLFTGGLFGLGVLIDFVVILSRPREYCP